MTWPIFIRQPATVTRISIRGLPFRVRSFWASIIGFSATAAVLTAILAIQAGFTQALVSAGSLDTAIITAAGAKTEIASVMTNSDIVTINAIRNNLDRGSDALSTAAVLTTASVPVDGGNSSRNLAFRGVQSASFRIHSRVRVTQGRRFKEGLNEVLVGSRLAAELPDLTIGRAIRLGSTEWMVVGLFESAGDLHESEIWTDVKTLQSIFNRGNIFQSMRVKLPTDNFYLSLKEALEDDPRIDVQVERERVFFAEQSGPMTRFIGLVGRFIAILMGTGAAFSIVNTMQTVISERENEIAILRVMGFGRFSILVAIMIEGMILGSIGGLIGAVGAYAAVDGLQASTLAFGLTSQLYFSFSVTPPLIQTGVVYALGLGMLGTLLPAVQAVRRSIVRGLQR